MKREEAEAMFILAGIKILEIEQHQNQYYPLRFVQDRLDNPWWHVKTTKGWILFGWRKRVISFHWEGTPIRQIITQDDVTKNYVCVHAWSYAKAVEYLTTFARIMQIQIMNANLVDGIEQNTLCLTCGIWNAKVRSSEGRCEECHLDYLRKTNAKRKQLVESAIS